MFLVINYGIFTYLNSSIKIKIKNILARFIDFLHLHGFVDFSKILITGHSLGAHVAGIAGKRVTRGRINTIIGMDPAGKILLNY